MDSPNANVLDRSILVKWAAPHAAQALFNKRGELSLASFCKEAAMLLLAL